MAITDLVRGVRIKSDNLLAKSLKVTTANGTEITGIRGVTINPLKKDSLITATIDVIVSEMDIVAEPNINPIEGDQKDAIRVD